MRALLLAFRGPVGCVFACHGSMSKVLALIRFWEGWNHSSLTTNERTHRF